MYLIQAYNWNRKHTVIVELVICGLSRLAIQHAHFNTAAEQKLLKGDQIARQLRASHAFEFPVYVILWDEYAKAN